MNCKYCGQKKKLVDAHIIPECFIRSLKVSPKGLKTYSSKNGIHPKRSPIGFYDSNILCNDCEDKFKLYDDYVCKVLLESKLRREIVKDALNKNNIGYIIHGVDYLKLKLFFMFTLWKAGISNREEFKKVQLGPYLKKVETHIKTNEPGSYNDFSVILSEQKFPNDMPVMLGPHRERFLEGINFYAIYIGRFLVHIKADNRKIGNNYINFVLQPNKPLNVPYLDFQGGKTERIIRDIIKVNKKLKK